MRKQKELCFEMHRDLEQAGADEIWIPFDLMPLPFPHSNCSPEWIPVTLAEACYSRSFKLWCQNGFIGVEKEISVSLLYDAFLLMTQMYLVSPHWILLSQLFPRSRLVLEQHPKLPYWDRDLAQFNTVFDKPGTRTQVMWEGV